MQELFIPIRFPNLNDYTKALKKHRLSGSNMKAEWTDLVVEWCKTKRLGHFTEPVFVEFHWYEPNKKRDMDNVAFAKKFILDGLQKAGVITNDNPTWILGFSDRFYYEGKKAGIRIIMRENDYVADNLDDRSE